MSQTITSAKPISPLRRRMIEDMTVRGFGEKTQSDYIRHVKNFTIFLRRSPDTATPEDVRAYQLSQREAGVQPQTMNATTSALRFFFTTTCGQAETVRKYQDFAASKSDLERTELAKEKTGAFTGALKTLWSA